MRAFGRLVACCVLSASAWVSTGCAVTCIEDATGTKCSAKSLQRFDGAVYAAGARANARFADHDRCHGNVLVQRSASGKVEVQFQPFGRRLRREGPPTSSSP
jgi:hypothetical protein